MINVTIWVEGRDTVLTSGRNACVNHTMQANQIMSRAGLELVQIVIFLQRYVRV